MAKLRNQRIRDPNARITRISEAPVERQLKEIRESLVDIWSVVSFFHIVTADDYTTSGEVRHETVLVDSTGTGTTTISLHSLPKIGHRVTVKRLGTKAVSVDTAGSETIDGGASTSLASQYDLQTYEAVPDDSGDDSSVNYAIIAEMVN
jgi:hypothetical protein